MEQNAGDTRARLIAKIRREHAWAGADDDIIVALPEVLPTQTPAERMLDMERLIREQQSLGPVRPKPVARTFASFEELEHWELHEQEYVPNGQPPRRPVQAPE